MTGDTESQALSTIPKIRVVEIISPMRLDHRSETWQDWSPAKSLAEYIPEGAEFIASVSGRIVPAYEWDSTYPLEDDCIVICPTLQGGGGGKSILRLVAFVALVVLTVYTFGAASAFYATYGATWAAVASAGMMIVGSMLINALLPIQPASLARNKADLSESPSYGINGATNTSDEGIGVPVCYGRYRMAGNIIGFYTENAGKTQNLYMLFNAGEGPVAGISNIEINGQPVSSFQDVETMVRTGTQDQDIIPWFADTVDLKDVGNLLIENVPLPDESQPYRVTSQMVDRLRVDIVAPQGLFGINTEDGSLKTQSVGLVIGYAPCDVDGNVTGDWNTDFGSASVATYSSEYHYLGDAQYDPDTGELIGGSTNETVTSTLHPHDVVVVEAVPVDWALDQVEEKGHVVKHDDLFWLCKGDHVANAHFEPGVGDQTDDAWIPLGTNTVNIDDIISEDGVRVGYVTQTAHYSGGGGDTTMTAQSRFPVRASFYSPPLTASYYRLQVVRTTDQADPADNIFDELHWEALGEIILDDINYVNTALLGLKIRLSDQLNSIPTVTYINEGILCRTYDAAANEGAGGWIAKSTGNPAWVALDMITNTRYGARVPWSAVDLAAFSDWAAFCDAQEPPLRFNGVLDQQISFWDAMKYVGRVGHASITRTGTRFSVVIEREEEPVMMFSEANVVKGTFTVNYLPLEERANTIDVSYWDEDDGYVQKTVKLIDPNLTDLAFERNAQLQLIGVTNRARAIREGWLQLNLNNWLQRTVQFQAGLDSIACVPGSVIIVKHVAQEVAVSGRFADNAGDTGFERVTLDSEITFQAGQAYVGTAIAPLGIAFTGRTIAAVDAIRNAVAVDGAVGGLFPPSQIGILLIGGENYGVTSTYTDPALPARSWFVIESDTDVSSITVGASVSAKCPDAMIVGSVSPVDAYGVPTTHVQWVGSSAAPNPIKEGWHYVIGPQTETRRLYRVIAIDPGNDPYTRTIKALEYHPEVYDATGYLEPPPPPGGGDGSGVIGHVQNLELDVNEVGGGENPRYELEAKWDPPSFGTYKGAIIYRRQDGQNEWKQITEVLDGATNYRFDAAYGEHVLIKVQAEDDVGNKPPFTTAPTAEVTVGQDTTVGVLPTGLFVTQGFQTLYVGWTVDHPERLKSTKIFATFDGDGEDPSHNPGDAQLITETMGLSYAVPAQAGMYRFWVKTVDKFGRESEFYPLPDGVTGSAIILVSDLMDALDDEIYASLLDQYLRDRIEIIPDLVDIDTFVASLNALFSMGLIGDGNGSAVQTVQATVTNDHETTAQSLTQLQSRMGSAEAAIQQEMVTRATEDLAEAYVRTQLAARLTGVEDDVGGVHDLIAGIDDELGVLVTADQAEANARRILATQLTGNTFDDTGSQTITTDSVIGSMQQAISTLNGPDGMIGSIAYQIQQLRTDLVYNEDNPLSAVNLSAGITETNHVITTLTEPGGAAYEMMAERIEQLWVAGTTPGGQIGRAIEQRMLVDDANAAYWLKIEVDNPGEAPIIAGFGLGYSQNDPTPLFRFIVRTNQFAIGDTSGSADYPFIFNDGSDGKPRGVYIRQAFIKEADIDTLRIAGQAVSAVFTGSSTVTVPNVPPNATVQIIGSATCHGHNDRLAARLDLYVDAAGVSGVAHGVSVLWFGNHDARDFDISSTTAGSWTNTGSTPRTITCTLRAEGSDGDGDLALALTQSTLMATVLKR